MSFFLHDRFSRRDLPVLFMFIINYWHQLCRVYLEMITDERQFLGGGRHALADDHQEDGHGQQSGDAQRHFLTGIGRHVKAHKSDARD